MLYIFLVSDLLSLNLQFHKKTEDYLVIVFSKLIKTVTCEAIWKGNISISVS